MKLTKYKQEISSITKMEDCIGSKIPSLSMIKKQFGEEDTLKAVGKKIKQVKTQVKTQYFITIQILYLGSYTTLLTNINYYLSFVLHILFILTV